VTCLFPFWIGRGVEGGSAKEPEKEKLNIRVIDHVLEVEAVRKAWFFMELGNERIFEGWIPERAHKVWASHQTFYIQVLQPEALIIKLDGRVIKPSELAGARTESIALVIEGR